MIFPQKWQFRQKCKFWSFTDNCPPMNWNFGITKFSKKRRWKIFWKRTFVSLFVANFLGFGTYTCINMVVGFQNTDICAFTWWSFVCIIPTEWITLIETTWTTPGAFIVTWTSIDTNDMITVTNRATPGWIMRSGTVSQTVVKGLVTVYFTIICFPFGIATE